MGRLRSTLVVMLLLLGGPIAVRAEDVHLSAGTLLHVRLGQLVSSFGSERDARVSATLIAPIEVDGRVLAPLGSEILGHVEDVRRVGLGLSHETAYVHLSFDTMRLPRMEDLAIAAGVHEVDNARETVDAQGRIRGIRATASFSSMSSGFAVSLGALDPMLLGFTTSVSLSMFRIPESEVILPVGTELTLRLLGPLTLSRDYGPIAPPVAASSDLESDLAHLVRALPFRTATDKTNVPSDLTNLVFLASRDALTRALDAANWGSTDPLSSRSSYAALRAIVENQGFREAPMSVLLLDGSPPAFTYAKTLDTFFKRHHVRVYGGFGTFDGLPVWTASSTHDTGIGFATRSRSFIHVIDHNIDAERDKVVYDLVLTGCVDGLTFVDRPWVPRDASNATGDALVTDGRAAVVRLDDCAAPQRADASILPEASPRAKPSAAERSIRNVTLWFKNDAFRGNFVYQGYHAAKRGVHALFSHGEPSASERHFTYGGEEFLIVPGATAREHKLAPDDPANRPPSFQPMRQPRQTTASFLELGLNAGYSTFGDNEVTTVLGFPVSFGDVSTFVVAARRTLEPRSGFGARATLNMHRHFSHEVSFADNHTTFNATLTGPDGDVTGISSQASLRQFAYNLLLHARPNGARVRPFVAVGPALQAIQLEGGIAATHPLLHRSFKDLWVISETWDFGSTPPLEGGSVFQVAFQYGGGLKVHLSPHLVVRADARATVSEQPDFWGKPPRRAERSATEQASIDRHSGILHHRSFTAGLAVAF
jgi:hypothetical protein